MNIAATDVVAASKGSPTHLATSSKKFGVAFDNLLHSGVEIIGGTRVFFSPFLSSIFFHDFFKFIYYFDYYKFSWVL